MNRCPAIATVVAVALLGLVGCSGDDADRASTAACPAPSDDDVTLHISWSGPWDEDAANAVIDDWETQHPNVSAAVRHEDRPFFGAPVALIGDAPPTVAAVSYAALPALVGIGAVRSIGDCLEQAGVDFASMVPAAVGKGDVGGRRYGAPANNDTVLMLYDRAAFRAAGLAPDDPPTTMAEVIEAARTLRSHGKPHPVAFDAPHLGLFGLDLDTPDARTAATQWVQLFEEDLLTKPEDFKGLPPLGSGAAAMQWVDIPTLLTYSSALAEGQAPAADVGVAPFPAFRGGVAPAGGSVWVISSKASDAEAAAAIEFIAWAEQPAQQAKLHLVADALPSTPSAVDEPSLRDRWDRQPLLRDAFTTFATHASTLRGWETTLGSLITIIPRLWTVGRGERDFDTTWNEITSLLHSLERSQANEPRQLLNCLAAHVDDKQNPVGRVCPNGST